MNKGLTGAAVLFALIVVACDSDSGPGSPDNGEITLPDSVRVFLDIRSQTRQGGAETGLLGLAFHPDYETNGYLYVYYSPTGTLRSRLSRFRVLAADADGVDPASEKVLLDIPEPFDNHNGGSLAFGPADGFLYIGVGDGGGGGDPEDNGQDRTSLHGSILRIDVDQNINTSPYYGIPAGNPYVGNADGYREEIWAYGFRNPWRISFDADTGWLWVGDVGQNSREEIDVVEGGMNYGWDCWEGTLPFPNSSDACSTATDLVAPVWEYNRSEGQSITGGYVYRGDSLSSLVGKYIYADFGSKRIWALDYDGTSAAQNAEIYQATSNISAIGADHNGEVYFLDYFGGKILTMEEIEGPPGTFTYNLYQPWPGLRFDKPVGLYSPGDGTTRLFVLEQAGRIFVFDVNIGNG